MFVKYKINMTLIKKQEIYRRAVRRKPNLEVTGEEKPKTRIRRRKPNKRLFREKSKFAPSGTKKASLTFARQRKPSLRRP